MRRSVVLIAVGAVILASAAAAAVQSTFYLDLKAGQCARPVMPKHYQVLPCSNGTHQFEVYAVVHGGWDHRGTPSNAVAHATAGRLCNAAFTRRFGGRIRAGYGWEAFWPDPGAEARKYGARIVCSLIVYPGHPPMGPGTHFRQAALR